MREIRTQIEIDTFPQTAWNILTDFSRFPDWNPLMRIDGVPRGHGPRPELKPTDP